MSRSITDASKGYFPFIWLLTLFTALISLSHIMASYVRSNVIAQEIDLAGFKMHGLMVVTVLLAIYLLATRKIAFEKVFTWTLKATVGLVILSYLFLFHSEWGFIFFNNVFPEIFFFLGWSYLNHVFSLNGARKAYFPILFFSMLLSTGLVYLPMIFGFGDRLMTDGIFGVMLLAYVLINVCLKWLNQKGIKLEKVQGKNFSLVEGALICIALGFLFLAMKWSSESLLLSLKAQAKSVVEDGSSYITLMTQGYLRAHVLGLILYGITFYKGAFIVKKYGWLKSMFITPFVAAIVFVIAGFIPHLDVMGLGFALINGLQGALVFPLLMMVFVAFGTKHRFTFLGFVILVIKPIMSYLFEGEKFYFASAFALSFGLIFLYFIISSFIGKKVMTQAIEQALRK